MQTLLILIELNKTSHYKADTQISLYNFAKIQVTYVEFRLCQYH